MSSTWRRRLPARRQERGAAAVEFALIVPILLLFVLGIIDFGRLYYTQINLTQAAREGARLEALGSSGTAVTNGVTTASTGLGTPTVCMYTNPTGSALPSSPSCTSTPSCSSGNDAVVRLTTSFTFSLAGLIPALGTKTVTGIGVIPCGG